MAVDEAILEAVGQGKMPTTLRLYAWQPPCLSLGYAQPVSEVDLPKLRTLGWDLVRRPTGGKAILHADELTYAVIAAHSEIRVAGSLLESYRHLSEALLHALQLLGIPAETKIPLARGGETPTPENDASPGAVCFEVPSHYEITVKGKKAIGSAQARRKEGILQHGSLPLHGDLGRIIQGLAYPSEAERAEARQRLLRRATTMEHVLGRKIYWQEASQAFISAFREALNLEFECLDLSPEEKRRANDLVEEKYAHPSWTERV